VPKAARRTDRADPAALLTGLRPMLASPGDLPPDDGWAFEFKWDGMRVLVSVAAGGEVAAISRNGNDALARFPELLALPDVLGGRQALLDGELVALDAKGRPDFGLMQSRMGMTDVREIERSVLATPAHFLAFDLLALDGKDLTGQPYKDRRRLLDGLGLKGDRLAAPPATIGQGTAILAASQDLGLEGVVAKRLDSPYLPGERSPHWVKVRNRERQEFVVGGWTPGEGNRAGHVGSLLLGVYGSPLGDRKLFYVGRTGSGFNEAMLAKLKAEMARLATDKDPFHSFEDEGDAPPRWVRPQLVCEVEFSGLAHRKVLRQASFKGLRVDKPAKDVVWEQAIPPPWAAD